MVSNKVMGEIHMNYILQLNALFDWLQANSLSPNAQLLYYTLLQINNKCGWMDWFQRTNMSLCGIMGISENTLKAARNELKTKGLIDFKPGKKKNDPTKYHLIELYNMKRVSNFDTQFDTKVDTQPDTKADTQPDDIYKLKQKEIVVVVEREGADYDQGLKKIVDVFSNNVHPITTLEYQKMQSWLNDIEADAIIFAIEEAVLQSKRTMSYIEGILKSYVGAGIKTRAQAEAQKREWIDRKNQGARGGAAKDNSKNQAAGSNIKSFNNFKNRTYDAKALEETLLSKTKNELLVGDEEFEQIMAERRTRAELNNANG